MAKINKITLEDAKVLEEALKIAKKCKLSCITTLDDYLRETEYGYFWIVPTINKKYLSLVEAATDSERLNKKELISKALMIPYVYQAENKSKGAKRKIGQNVLPNEFVKSYRDLIALDEKYDLFTYTIEELLLFLKTKKLTQN